MSLSPGSRIGRYEITAKLGEGGMGVVYRATDPKLRREVALKLLPDAVAEDRERLARFEREAQLLAQLHHPAIAALHGLEETDGVQALVMELVEGPTLAERLASGPLPIDEALEAARQIAEALEAAHENGIVHRDLKPQNIKLSAEGTVKVLDFGLAKATDPASGAGSGNPLAALDLTRSPTLTAGAGTQLGVVLGTAAYMAPEQARGRMVDKRADIWAFGVVLYEMLTGRKLFEGETATDILSAVLRQEIVLDELPATTPPSVRRLLARCLERDPKRRLRDIGDARHELESPVRERSESALQIAVSSNASSARPWLPWLAFAAGALLAAVATWLATREPNQPPIPVTRFALYGIGMPVDAFQGFALSPDGRQLVYRARGSDGRELLQLRSFDSYESQPLRGSELGWFPFFSPDGERIGFHSPRGLVTMSVEGGAAHPIADSGAGFAGATWLPDDTIVFTGLADRRFRRVSASGGPVETLEVQGLEDEETVLAPWALPDGQALLCTVQDGPNFDVAVYDLAARTLTRIAENGFTPTWTSSGHVIYQQGLDGPLMALPFDARRRVATGRPTPVLSDLGQRMSQQARMFAVAADGTLAYVPKSSALDRGVLLWVDREGTTEPIVELPKVLDTPRISPDGSRIAFRTPAPNCDIWVHDLERGVTTRVTHEGDSHGNAWSPDGERIAVSRRDSLEWTIGSLAADGAGELERLSAPIPSAFAAAYSPDGERVLVQSRREATGIDVESLSVRERTVTPLLASRFHERAPALSPDGRLLAYTSDETGRHEVYVQTFPALDVRRQISTDGGTEPVWSRSGKELFFRAGRDMMAVDIDPQPSLRAGRPRLLFSGEFGASGFVASGSFALPSYDVAADGRFVMVRERSGAGGAEIHVVQNWFEELRSLEAKNGQ